MGNLWNTKMTPFLLIAASLALTYGYPISTTSTPLCSDAGQPNSLCAKICSSPCRGFKPAFQYADCANETACSDTPKWAQGSVCLCSPTPPTPPAPSATNCTKDADCPGTNNYCMDGPDKTPPYSCHNASPPAPLVATCKEAGKEMLCEIACE